MTSLNHVLNNHDYSQKYQGKSSTKVQIRTPSGSVLNNVIGKLKIILFLYQSTFRVV